MNQHNDEPQTPKTCPSHERLNETVIKGWLKYLLLAIAIGGFILAMKLLR